MEKKLVSELYRYLMLVAAMLVCLGHGSNDVSNSISPLLVVLQAHDGNIKHAYLLGSAGIALGLLLLGYKVMETVGKKVIKLDFPKGFSAQFATAMAVILGTVLGMPLSTTHCMVGSLLGLVLAGKTQVFRDAYRLDTPDLSNDAVADKNENVKDENSFKDPAIIGKIVCWWAATVPVALVTSLAITKVAL